MKRIVKLLAMLLLYTTVTFAQSGAYVEKGENSVAIIEGIEMGNVE